MRAINAGAPARKSARRQYAIWYKRNRHTRPTLPLREGRNSRADAKRISGRGDAPTCLTPPPKISRVASDFSTLPQGEGWCPCIITSPFGAGRLCFTRRRVPHPPPEAARGG